MRRAIVRRPFSDSTATRPASSPASPSRRGPTPRLSWHRHRPDEAHHAHEVVRDRREAGLQFGLARPSQRIRLRPSFRFQVPNTFSIG